MAELKVLQKSKIEKKKERLKTAFKLTLINMLEDTQNLMLTNEYLIEKYANLLVKEVSIRTQLK